METKKLFTPVDYLIVGAVTALEVLGLLVVPLFIGWRVIKRLT